MRKKNAVRAEGIHEILHEVRHYLPSQGPIKDFIHHNTLHTFQDEGLSFHEAIRKASQLYGSREYLPVEEYRNLYRSGEISDQAVRLILTHEKDVLLADLMHAPVDEEIRRRGFRSDGYLQAMTKSAGINLEESVHPIIFKLLSSFLDQGISALQLNGALDFWTVLKKQLKESRPAGIDKNLSALISEASAESAAELILAEILPAGSDKKTFVLEVFMAARGWSGLVAQIEENPTCLNYTRNIRLIDYLALYLCVLQSKLRENAYDKDKISNVNPHSIFFSEPATESDAEKISRLWHEAYEMEFYCSALAAIRTNAVRERGRSSAAMNAKFQAVFCIDDRECSMHRYLKDVSPRIETFGTPGFFAIDAVYQGPFDAIHVKQCPVPVTPKHKIRGVAKKPRARIDGRLEMNFWHRHANSVLMGWCISLVFGLVSLLRLVLSVHRPSRTYSTASSFTTSDDEAELHYERAEGEAARDGFFEGYTVPEMAERVAKLLNQIGLTTNFGHLVAMVGHGSSSTNNPYFAAYDCGACSGRPGFVNARTFALMANRDDVRKILAKQGLKIPISTRFVGAIHDTARDEIYFIDEDDLIAHHSEQLAELKTLFSQALEKNAMERTRRFAIVDFPTKGSEALKEARMRTQMLFEPRPEYNHATNAMAIVGRSSLIENLFLDRRAFFNSYDPIADKDGSILNQILTPLVPVCGGINLEYLFSRLDNTIFGSGSKLPHNVFSLLGVGNGAEGDLRTGLPEQMVEIHDPIRLMVLVEQRISIVKNVLAKNLAVNAWIENEWIKFFVYDHLLKKFYLYRNGRFEEFSVDRSQYTVYPDWHAAFFGKRGNITPARVLKGKDA